MMLLQSQGLLLQTISLHDLMKNKSSSEHTYCPGQNLTTPF